MKELPMKRLLIASAVVTAALATATPAVAGLAGNPSFSHKLPVRVPSQAQVVKFDDHNSRSSEAGDDRGSHSSPVVSATVSRSPEPGDDRGGVNPEPGDDRGGVSPEPGDDRGGASRSPEPGDDHGGGHGGSGHGSGK
jgi:hypothetical protein